MAQFVFVLPLAFHGTICVRLYLQQSLSSLLIFHVWLLYLAALKFIGMIPISQVFLLKLVKIGSHKHLSKRVDLVLRNHWNVTTKSFPHSQNFHILQFVMLARFGTICCHYILYFLLLLNMNTQKPALVFDSVQFLQLTFRRGFAFLKT